MVRMSRERMATTGRAFLQRPEYSICLPRCMRMRRREAAEYDCRDRSKAEPHPGNGAFCARDFRGLWFPWPAQANRPHEIYYLVPDSVSAHRCRRRLGHVPVLALTESLQGF